MWTIKSWRGSVYPQKAPQRLWPELYGEQFAAIEFNATHYRIYPPEKMAAWAKDMPRDFRFCAKFPQLISHFRRFNNCEGPTDDFIDGILALGHHAGVSFIQLPPHYAPKHAVALASYLQKWPRELPLAIEFRHADWFSETPEARDERGPEPSTGQGSLARRPRPTSSRAVNSAAGRNTNPALVGRVV
mgnify:CR=1 FL=1